MTDTKRIQELATMARAFATQGDGGFQRFLFEVAAGLDELARIKGMALPEKLREIEQKLAKVTAVLGASPEYRDIAILLDASRMYLLSRTQECERANQLAEQLIEKDERLAEIARQRADFFAQLKLLKAEHQHCDQVMTQRDHWEEQVGNMAAQAGCEDEFSSAHDHSSCVAEYFAVVKAERDEARTQLAGVQANFANLGKNASAERERLNGELTAKEAECADLRKANQTFIGETWKTERELIHAANLERDEAL